MHGDSLCHSEILVLIKFRCLLVHKSEESQNNPRAPVLPALLADMANKSGLRCVVALSGNKREAEDQTGLTPFMGGLTAATPSPFMDGSRKSPKLLGGTSVHGEYQCLWLCLWLSHLLGLSPSSACLTHSPRCCSPA